MLLLNENTRAKYQAEICPVLDNRVVSPGYHRIQLQAPAIARTVEPGQFVQVFMPSRHSQMLPRPFSVYRANPAAGELTLLLEVKGRGTALLAEVSAGAALKLLGPLGRGFPSPPPHSLLVAGGMGIVPLAFLAASTGAPGTLIYCARTAGLLVCPRPELDRPGLSIIEATDDGSRGEQGTAADLLSRRIEGAGAVFACGPRLMLAAVKKICRRAGVKAWFSLEERMACGIGACLGCAVATTGGYRRVCRDGPVFPAEEVILDE